VVVIVPVMLEFELFPVLVAVVEVVVEQVVEIETESLVLLVVEIEVLEILEVEVVVEVEVFVVMGIFEVLVAAWVSALLRFRFRPSFMYLRCLVD
jgi:hypothetical protein